MKDESRTVQTVKNFTWATIGNIITYITGFITQTVFIYTLGKEYLGINGLFTNLLGILSLAELGIGSAISFSLYKPLAEKQIGKVAAIIHLYKQMYRFIALIVTLIGIGIIPLLPYIINGGTQIEHLTFIYLIFLFNSVSSYLISYKSTLLSADQKNYYITNVNTVVRVFTSMVQAVVLMLFHSFYFYLVSDAIIQLGSKIYLNYFTDKKYPYLQNSNIQPLNDDEKHTILTKVKGMIFHKIGEVSIYQTDNVITSACIDLGTVGLVSNFTLIVTMVSSFISSFFNAAIAGFGNLIVKEDEDTSLKIFKKYDFLDFLFYGWSGLCLMFLLTPFVKLWLGEPYLIDPVTVMLLCINYYLTGQRVSLGNVKSAAGVFEQDWWSPILQSILNILISILGAKWWGLKGIYIGTLVSSMVPNIVRPYMVYRYVFGRSSRTYFIEYLKRIGVLVVCYLVISLLSGCLEGKLLIIELFARLLICTAVFALICMVIYHKTDEFLYLKNMFEYVKRSLRRE